MDYKKIRNEPREKGELFSERQAVTGLKKIHQRGGAAVTVSSCS